MDATQFQSMCKKWQGCTSDFSKIVSSACTIGLSDEDLAIKFAISEYFIAFWKDGQMYPHPKVQKHVVSSLKHEASSFLSVSSKKQIPPAP